MGIYSSFNIGIKGIFAQSMGLEVTGHNIANASNDGFSKQRVIMDPSDPRKVFPGDIGTGVDVTEIKRIKDKFLDSKIREDYGSIGRLEQMQKIYRQIEIYFNESPLANDETAQSGFQGMLNNFWEDWQKVATNPDDESFKEVLKEQAVMMTQMVNHIDTQLSESQIVIDDDIKRKVERINELTTEIAALNKDIKHAEAAGRNPNDLLDSRDVRLNELAGLIETKVNIDSNGYMNVTSGGNLILSHASSYELTATKSTDGFYRVSYERTGAIFDPIKGALKGLIEGRDEAIPQYRAYLDNLVRSIIVEVNKIHSTGLGVGSGLSSITSTNAVSDADAALDKAFLPFNPQSGSLWITVYDPNGTVAEQREITITAGTTSLNDLQSDIDAMTNLSASVSNGLLTIDGVSGYTFAFNTGINGVNGAGDPPMDPDWTGASTATPTMGGFFDGTADDTWTFTVTSGGTVGTDDVTVEVRNGSSALIKSITLGDSYNAGEAVLINGTVTVAFGAGDLVAGDTFQADMIADADTSNILASLGINSFFKGKDAGSFGVDDYIITNVNRIAASKTISPGGPDNALDIGALQSTNFTFAGTAATESPVWHGGSKSMSTISLGTYTAATDDKWKFTVNGAGTVGTTAGLTVTVTDEDGATVGTYAIGSTYTGDAIDIGEGVYVKFDTSAGNNTVEAGDYFHVTLNGREDPKTSTGYYAGLITNLGINAEHQNKELANTTTLVQYLEESRDSSSSVSIDEEMVNLIKYQTAYQASAKFISILQRMADITVSIVQ